MTKTTNKIVRGAVIAALCSSAAFAQAPVQAPAPAPQVQESIGGGAGTGVPAADGEASAQATLRRGTEISAEALASAPYLYFDRDAKGRLRPGSGKVENIKKSAAYQLFDKAIVRFSENVSYKVGDTVDVVSIGRQIKLNGQAARIVTRQGRAVVQEPLGDTKLVILLTEMWGVISGGESIVPTVSFVPFYCDNLVVPNEKIEGSVVTRIGETVTTYLHQFLIIDKGANDGVKLGDFFRVKEKKRADELSEELLEGQVVNITPVSATLVVHKLFKSNLNAGDYVFLSHRQAQ